MSKNYRLLATNLKDEYKNKEGRAFFTFKQMIKLVNTEINEPSNWFVERKGNGFLNAHHFLYMTKSTDETALAKHFTTFQ